MTEKRAHLYRSPTGVLSEKPIAMRLMPNERKLIEKLAAKNGRSMGSECRILLLKGFESLGIDSASDGVEAL